MVGFDYKSFTLKYENLIVILFTCNSLVNNLNFHIFFSSEFEFVTLMKH
jgi:hypothetical protein